MKKGFTLIELLAVIVILAVLALIATPIVLNIIDDSKKNATLRSSENYIKAIEFSIAKSVMENKRLNDGEYPIMSNGNICLGTLTGSTCDNELIVEVSGETPESGTVTIKSRKIDSYEFTYASGFVVINGSISSGEEKEVCKLIDGEPNEIGTKYQCKVKEGLPSPYQEGYYFYVLSHEDDGTTNLIMERNICEDGTVATQESPCLVAWYEDGDDNSYGPVTATTYLNSATSTWENIDNLNITYDDEGGHFIDFALIGKARMPYYSEVSDYDGTNGYLYNYLSAYLDDDAWVGVHEDGFEHIIGIGGYLTLSSSIDGSSYAKYVTYLGNVAGGISDESTVISQEYGVRPVINVKL